MANLSHLRPMSVGEILDSAFGVYRRHFVPLFVTVLIPLVPLAVANVAITWGIVAEGGPRAAERMQSSGLALSLVSVVLLLPQWGALARIVERAWTGEPVSVADGYRHGARAFFPLLGATILSILAVFAIMIGVWLVLVIGAVVVLLGARGAGGAPGSGGFAALAVGVGALSVFLMLAVVVWVSATLFAILPSVVVERAGPVQAIRRSLALSRGARMRIAGVIAVALLIFYLPLLGAMLLTGSFDQVLHPGTLPSPGQMVAQQVVGALVGALVTPFLAASFVLLYFDRRVRTEALDVHTAAEALPSF